jgi:hypothetical protein
MLVGLTIQQMKMPSLAGLPGGGDFKVKKDCNYLWTVDWERYPVTEENQAKYYDLCHCDSTVQKTDRLSS